MKKIICICTCLCVCATSFAQNKDFRVEKITQMTVNRDNSVDTIVQLFTYKDGLLNTIQLLQNENERELYTYLYSKNNIKVQNKKGTVVQSYVLGTNGEVEEFVNNNCTKYTILYVNGKIKSIERLDKCDEIDEMNDFEYLESKLTKVKVYPKKYPQYPANYEFIYDNDMLSKLIWGNNIDTYDIQWDNGQIASITSTELGKNAWKREYIYDSNQNIAEEEYYAIINDVATLKETYVISYEKNTGNDNIIWSMYDWKINTLIQQRTYKNFVQRNSVQIRY